MNALVTAGAGIGLLFPPVGAGILMGAAAIMGIKSLAEESSDEATTDGGGGESPDGGAPGDESAGVDVRAAPKIDSVEFAPLARSDPSIPDSVYTQVDQILGASAKSIALMRAFYRTIDRLRTAQFVGDDEGARIQLRTASDLFESLRSTLAIVAELLGQFGGIYRQAGLADNMVSQDDARALVATIYRKGFPQDLAVLLKDMKASAQERGVILKLLSQAANRPLAPLRASVAADQSAASLTRIVANLETQMGFVPNKGFIARITRSASPAAAEPGQDSASARNGESDMTE